MSEKKLTVYVTDAPYNAVGDDKTNDREAIQRAIDDVWAQGGGTVVLTEGKKFFSGSIYLKSNVELHFGDGAMLHQSDVREHYVKPVEGGYEPYLPLYGHNVMPGIAWSHAWFFNYPMIFAAEGTHDIKISGKGTIRMMEIDDLEKLFKICPIGMYKVTNFEISDIEITNYHSYGMMVFQCNHGIVRGITIHNNCHGNGDGINLMNCQNIRVTGCTMSTGDDSVYIFSSYNDPRGGGWWSSADPQPSVNIEIDHNDLESDHCKAFGMILWGITCPDKEKVEVRNVYIHDNHFKSMGNWNYCPYTKEQTRPPVTNFRFENNVIDTIEENFFETKVSDMNCFRSMTSMLNGNFKDGRCFWSMKTNGDENSAGVVRDEELPYGYIKDLDKGNAAIYQGLYIKTGESCVFRASLCTDGNTCRMFIRDLDSGELIAAKDFNNTDWEIKELEFTVPKDANYHVGIEGGDAEKGWARISDARLLGNFEGACGYKRVCLDDGKVLYVYNEI